MCDPQTQQRINRIVNNLSEIGAQHLLAFAQYLETRYPEPKILFSEEDEKLSAEYLADVLQQPMSPPIAPQYPEPKTMSAEEETKLFAELRTRAEARPYQTESAGEFMCRIRAEARY